MQKNTKWFLIVLILVPVYAFGQEADNLFYPHHILYSQDIEYGDRELQKLDVFYRGTRTGEPDWVSISEERYPVALHIHGGGWLGNDKAHRMHDVMTYVQQGFNVVNMNYRLGPDTAPQAVEDVMHVLKWIDEHADRYRFDTSRVVLTGTSAGGHLSLIGGLLNNHPDNPWPEFKNDVQVKAVVNWYGITDIEAVEEYLQSRNRGSNYARTWIGDTTKIDRISKRFSPVEYTDGDQRMPAIITIHGRDDTVVPFEQARKLHEKLDRSGAPNQLLPQPGGNHGGFTDQQYREAYQAIFNFLKEQGIY